MIRRGDIRWFRFSIPDKRRPVLIVTRDDLIQSLSQVTVIPFSSRIRGLDWEVVLGREDGLPCESTLRVESIKSVEKIKLGAHISSLPLDRWADVRRALLHVLGFDE